MSWYFAAATFAAGTIGAVGKRKSARAMARERRRAAHESLLTAKYNIRERNKESRQTQFQVLETGGNLTQQIAIEGKRAEGAATVAGGSSGAVIDSGSPRAVLTNIAQEALTAQTDAILDTKNRIKAISRDTENQNKSEWRNAKLNQRQQNRIAGNERDAADREFTADMMNTGIKTYDAYKTAEERKEGEKKQKEKEKKQLVLKTNDARSAPTNWDRFKYNLKNRPFRPFTSNWSSALDWRSNKKTYNMDKR